MLSNDHKLVHALVPACTDHRRGLLRVCAHAAREAAVLPDNKRRMDNNVLCDGAKTRAAREDAIPLTR